MIESINAQTSALESTASITGINMTTKASAKTEEMTGLGEGTTQDIDDTVQISAQAMKAQGR